MSSHCTPRQSHATNHLPPHASAATSSTSGTLIGSPFVARAADAAGNVSVNTTSCAMQPTRTTVKSNRHLLEPTTGKTNALPNSIARMRNSRLPDARLRLAARSRLFTTTASCRRALRRCAGSPFPQIPPLRPSISALIWKVRPIRCILRARFWHSTHRNRYVGGTRRACAQLSRASGRPSTNTTPPTVKTHR